MDLNEIINQANSKGYKIECNLDSSTIKTKQGDIKIILNEGQGQALCFPFGKKIYLFKKNKDIIGELLHEKDHFEILPYDLISFGLIYGPLMTYSIYKVAQSTNWFNASMVAAMDLFVTIMGGLNLHMDGIIYVRKKLKLGSFQKH